MAPKAPDSNGNVRRNMDFLHTFVTFFVFAVLVSIVEDYLSAEYHVLPAQF